MSKKKAKRVSEKIELAVNNRLKTQQAQYNQQRELGGCRWIAMILARICFSLTFPNYEKD
jgi:hypothetical protein